MEENEEKIKKQSSIRVWVPLEFAKEIHRRRYENPFKSRVNIFREILDEINTK